MILMQRTINNTDNLAARTHETIGRDQPRRADCRKGERPTILLSPRAFTLPTSYPGKRYLNALKKSVESYDLLRSKGHNVKMLCPSDYAIGDLPRFMLGTDMEERRPGSTLGLGANDCGDAELAMRWPRDRFQVYGDLVFAQHGSEPETREIISALGFPRSVVIEGSVLGEGGLVARAGKTLVISEAARARGIRRGELECLRHRGYDVHFLPVENSDFLENNRRKWPYEHIDTEFGLVFTEGGNALACVNPGYYSTFRKRVDRLAKDIGARLHVASEGESSLGVNFISLPKGKAIMADSCPSTQHFLERNLGSRNVTALPIDATIYLNGGGLRCMSNVIE
ncbi:Uncharacterised protein [uncultured archaeon]|nr:Uncharacterised protein [uncultured archaeon]